MNTKKGQWVEKPQTSVKYDLHTISWEEKNSSSIYWTLGEEGEITLSYNASEPLSVSFSLLHTPSDYITFSSEGITSSFFGLKSFTSTSIPSSLTLRKTEEKLTFLNNDKAILTLENSAFLGSASFGFIIKGRGDISISVF